MPTKNRYIFEGKGNKPDTASIDLAIEPDGKRIIIELKEGQPEIKKIQKDFEKLLREETSGCAFFHILKNSHSGTLPSLFKKYKEAYDREFITLNT